MVSFHIKGPLSPCKSTKLPDPTPDEVENKTGMSQCSHESNEAATISASNSRKVGTVSLFQCAVLHTIRDLLGIRHRI